MAGLNAWMKGCMSVLDRSAFSYQVAAGSTTSDSRVVDVIRKSIDISRSSLPSGCHRSTQHRWAASASGAGCACRFDVVPSRWRRKYSLPLLDGRAGWPARRSAPAASSRDCRVGDASFSSPEPIARRRRRGSPRRRPGLVGDVEAGPVELRIERVQPIATAELSTSIVCLSRNRPRPSGLARRRPGSRRSATGRCGCTSTRCRPSGAAARPVGAHRHRAHPVTGRHFSWPT